MDNRWEISTDPPAKKNNPFLTVDPRFHLHLVQKRTKPSERPAIHSTEWERLSFYRAYTAAAYKSQIIIMPHVGINGIIWFYVFNIFFKTLPHSFVHYFIASYAPEEHLFLTKMVPICHGFKYLVVISAFLEMILHVDTIMVTFHYALDGIARKCPWNRCANATYYDEYHKVLMHCYSLEDFAAKVSNTTIHYDRFAYMSEDNEIFQLSQIEYYRRLTENVTNTVFIQKTIYFFLIWLAVTLLHKQVEKKTFWRLLNGCQWAINCVDMTTFLYLLVYDYKDETIEYGPHSEIIQPLSLNMFSPEFWTADVDFLAESTSAPAVIHILTARSTQEISPGMACAKMVISNTMLWLFRAFLEFKVKTYAESVIHAEIFPSEFYQRGIFLFWPIFYANFYLGNIFIILFSAFNGLTEVMVLSVVYHCLIQTITYEWTKIKNWFTKGILFIAGLCLAIFTSVWTQAILFIYSKGIVTLTESVFLYVLYPLGRLVDDYTYHYGAPPTRLRILNLRLVPVYYMFKFFFMMQSVLVTLQREEFRVLVPHYLWSWFLMIVPLFLGILITLYKYLIKFRMTWQYIFRPQSKWGPRDFSERQLRKQYISKYYISSEVPKLLSRYLMSKRETEVYKVDVRYDVQRRSTVTKAVGFGASLNFDKKET